MHTRASTRDGQPALEWPWDGNDEMTTTHGSGWAMRDGELHGALSFPDSDECALFIATHTR